MKPKKLSLAEIQGKLSRAEMKRIMAGSEQEDCNCNSKDECKEGEVCGSDCKAANNKQGHCTTQ